MIQYIFFVLFLIFTCHQEYITDFYNICYPNNTKYKPFELYNKEGFDCMICYCTTTEPEICDKINICKQMQCHKNFLYEKKCCEKLKCDSILYLIKIKNITYMFISAQG